MTRSSHLSLFSTHKVLNKGASGDIKYFVETCDGAKFFLRMVSNLNVSNLKEWFNILSQIYAKEVPMAAPIETGIYDDDGGYILSEWINGEELVGADSFCGGLYQYPVMTQYLLGMEMGRSLRSIHSINIVPDKERVKHTKSQLENLTNIYSQGLIAGEVNGNVKDYIDKYKHLLNNRPLGYIHNDFYPSNMMIENFRIKIVDFNFLFGDPWSDFKLLGRNSAHKADYVESGILHGYFNGDPPKDFWIVRSLHGVTEYFERHYANNDSSDPNIQALLRRWHSNLIFDIENTSSRDYVPHWFVPSNYVMCSLEKRMSLKAELCNLVKHTCKAVIPKSFRVATFSYRIRIAQLMNKFVRSRKHNEH